MGFLFSCALAAVLFYLVGPFGVLAVVCGLFAGGWFNELWDTTNGQSPKQGCTQGILIWVFMIPTAIVVAYLLSGDGEYIEVGNAAIETGVSVVQSFWDVGH